MNVGRNDLDSRSSLWCLSVKDGQGNKLFGDIMSINTNNNDVNSSSRFVFLAGVDYLGEDDIVGYADVYRRTSHA